MKPFLARCIISMLLLYIRMLSSLSFTFILRVSAAMSLSFPESDVPGQHRRAFNTNMQAPVPIVSINAFIRCLNQDSMTDFYVLPRFRKLSAPRIVTTPRPQLLWSTILLSDSQIRPRSAFPSNFSIICLLNSCFFPYFFSASWLLANGLENPILTPW
jgi:hypothetical protein